MPRPRLLDLFCGGGGAAVGYARAGFDVLGVDRKFSRDFPFPILVADALDVLADTAFLALFDLIHTSPPCQEHTAMRSLYLAQGYQAKPYGRDLISPVRQALIASGKPYIIENVPNAPLVDPVQLCGSSFRLAVRRHRLFESNLDLKGSTCDHVAQGDPVGVYGSAGDAIPGGGRIARTTGEAGLAMGIDWMRKWEQIKEAIPPVYSEYLGIQAKALIS